MSEAFDPARPPLDLAWPIALDGAPLADAFGLPAPSAAPVVVGDARLSTKDGASVNCAMVRLTPHAAGTHTECVGHIVDEPVFVRDVAPTRLLLGVALTVDAVPLGASGESYAGRSTPDDEVVTRRALDEAFAPASGPRPRPPEALIVRALSARLDEDSPRFSGRNPPYFTREALGWITETLAPDGALVTNLPSIDREDDGGTTPNHRAFWAAPAPAPAHVVDRASRRTITELARLGALAPGAGWLSLGTAPLLLDAAPSRPLFFPLAARRAPG